MYIYVGIKGTVVYVIKGKEKKGLCDDVFADALEFYYFLIYISNDSKKYLAYSKLQQDDCF